MSELKVNKISPRDGTAFTLGDSGDTFTVPAGANIVNSGTATGFGGGAWTMISTTEISNSASLTITGITATYSVYGLFWSNLHPSISGAELRFRVGDANGIDSGSTDYRGASLGNHSNNGQAVSNTNTQELSYVRVDGIPVNGMGADAGQGASGHMYIYHPRSSNLDAHFQGQSMHIGNDEVGYHNSFWAHRRAVIALDRVNFYLSTGQLEQGRFTLYGISHA